MGKNKVIHYDDIFDLIKSGEMTKEEFEDWYLDRLCDATDSSYRAGILVGQE